MTLFERVHMPSFAGATEWLNSEPLGPAELRGRVVLVNFWTWTCINWLRQEPYVRAWSQAYRDDGLVVIGVHTPEFSFEHDIDRVRQATKERAIDYPVAVDNVATVSEANGRASLYLAALSSNLIALAFVGQMSRLGTAFYAFALILLPVLAFVGVVTFQRLVQLSIEDIAYAQRIARLREFYLGVAPELEAYLLVLSGQRAEGLLHNERLRPSAWQLTLTTAGMIAAVNSVVIGACVGLAVTLLPIGTLVVALTTGAVAGLAALSIQRRHHRRASDRYTPEDVDRAAIFGPATPWGRS